MALDIKGCVTIKEDGSEVYIEFLNATGNYHVTDNPGGFGAPNPTRNSLAIVLYATHKLVSGDVDASIQVYNPLSVASFTVNLDRSKNGVLFWNIIALPIFNNALVYQDGDVVWDNTNPSAAFAKEMIAGEWIERPLKDLLGKSTVIQHNNYSFPIPNAIRYMDKLSAKKLSKLRDYINGECGEEDYLPLRDSYEYVQLLILTGTTAFRAQAYNEAQIAIEEVLNYETKTANG